MTTIPKFVSGSLTLVALVAGLVGSEASLNVRDAQLGWDYTLEAQATIQGFHLYRSVGDVCAVPLVDLTPEALIATLPPEARTVTDAAIPDDFAGEVCYVMTSFGWFTDDAGTIAVRESIPSNHVGKSFLRQPAWWGESVAVR